MTVAVSAFQHDYGGALQRPIMVVGNSPAARSRACSTAEASGRDIIAELTTAEALDRFDDRSVLAALWVELDEELSLADRRLLNRADQEARARRCPVVVATRLDHIDEVLSELTDSGVELVVDADDAERLAVLSLAIAAQEGGSLVRDASSEASSARLRQLSEEVSRIAAALSRLSSTPSGPPLSPATMAPPTGDLPAVSAEAVRTMLRARRLRANYMPADLFADPAWDMLLDLLQAEIVQHRVPVSSLCIAAAVPATTALRWIKSMTDRGILRRRDDPHDGRRVFIEMAPDTSAAIRRYFQEVGFAAA